MSLALGIGVNTMIFSLVSGVILRPLPYKEPNRLVMLWEHDRRRIWHQMEVDPENLFDWRKQNQVFDDIAALGHWLPHYKTGTGAERLLGGRISANLFTVLVVKPFLGRPFLAEEDRPGADNVILLSHSCWRRRFGADPNIIGKTLTLDDASYIVVGIMPSNFRFPQPKYQEQPELVKPLALGPPKGLRGGNQLYAVARLKPGVTLERARADMDIIAQRLEEQHPKSLAGMGVTVIPLSKQVVGEVDRALLVLLGTVTFILLITCANLASLMSARALERRKECAIRAALGASRFRLIRQLLTESTVLAVLGGATAALLAYWGENLLIGFMPGNVPRLDEVRIDTTALCFTLLISIFTALLFGLLPALEVSKPDLIQLLKEWGRRSTGGLHTRLRSFLVIGQMALALVLLVGSGLLIRSFLRLQRIDLGFNAKNVLTAEIWLPRTQYEAPYQWVDFFEQLCMRVRSLPGVRSVGAVSQLPLSKGYPVDFEIKGNPFSDSGRPLTAEFRRVTVDYFRTMDIPLLRGRQFTEGDNADGPPVLIINETMADRSWPHEDPIGKNVRLLEYGKVPWLTVVGVVKDSSYYEPVEGPRLQMYVPFLATPWDAMYLVVRTEVDPTYLVASVRREVWAINKDVPVDKLLTMDQLLSSKLSLPRFNMLSVSIFAALALLSAVVGTYGIMAYSVTERTHEFAVRVALGASPSDIFKLTIRQGTILALTGISIGVAAAFALTRVMASLLYEVTTSDPLTFAGVSLLLAMVALLASYVPGRRATKVDPMVALRHE